jgi:hypothetical protein
MTHDLKFGWLSPVIGNAGSDHQAIVLYQQEHILPTVPAALRQPLDR